jgi:hypothetical protein
LRTKSFIDADIILILFGTYEAIVCVVMLL